MNGAAPEIPFAKEVITIFSKTIDGNMAFKNTKTRPETRTLTHQGD
jgi:hypothetical protein